MKKYLALAFACCLPTGLAAEDPADSLMTLGTTHALMIEESTPVAGDVLCARNPADKTTECMAFHRAVLTARLQKVSVLRERGRWM